MDNEIKMFVARSEWETLIQKCDPKKVAATLSYEDGMNAAHDIFCWNYRKDKIINYAIDLFFAIRELYVEEWNRDCKNDLYVSFLCELTLRYQEGFDSIKRAYELSLPNPSALVLYSFACTYFLPEPDVDTISKDEAIKLFKESIEKDCMYEAVSRLAEIYEDCKDIENYNHWDAVAKEAESKNHHVPIIVPDIFRRKTENEHG